MPRGSRSLTLAGALACVIGLVGYAVFGWRFDGDSSGVAVAIALGAVTLALVSTFRDRL